MIEFRKVAEFVDDDVVRKMRRKKQEPIVEVEIAALRTAPPARARVFDEHAAVYETILRAKRRKPLVDKRPRRFLMREIMLVGVRRRVRMVPEHTPQGQDNFGSGASNPRHTEFIQ